METYETYRGYGIRYFSITGTTVVEKYGTVIATFSRQGAIKGKNSACKWVDSKIKVGWSPC